MFKFVSLIFMFSLLFVGNVTAESNREAFLTAIQNDFDSGSSVRRIIIKFEMQDYAGQELYISKPLTDKELDEFEAYELEDMRIEQEKLSFITNIKNQDCETIFEAESMDLPDLSDPSEFLLGFFAETGICEEVNPAKAAEIYTKNIKRNFRSQNAKARLGNLYLNGRGVEQNIELANYYFKSAVIENAWNIWLYNADDQRYVSKQTASYQAWQLSNDSLEQLFSDEFVGPWELPEQLTNQILWVKNLSNSEIFEIAKLLYNGTGGYEQNLDNAIDWISYVDGGENYSEALYLNSIWNMEEDDCEGNTTEDRDLCDILMESNISGMEDAAINANEDALLYIIKYYEDNPNLHWADWKLLEFILIAQKNNIVISQDQITDAQNKVGSLAQQIIEAWVINNDRFSLGMYLPDDANQKIK